MPYIQDFRDNIHKILGFFFAKSSSKSLQFYSDDQIQP